MTRDPIADEPIFLLLRLFQPLTATYVVGTECGRGSTLEALPLRKGYYRLDAASVDVRVCPDAQINCSTTFGTSKCASASACQGGVGDPCANNLTGVYCLLCNRSDLAAPVYYKRSTSDALARCAACGDTVANTVFAGLGILAAAILVVLLVRRQRRKLPKEWIARLRYLKDNFTLFDKGKICFAFYQITSQVPRINEISDTCFRAAKTLLQGKEYVLA